MCLLLSVGLFSSAARSHGVIQLCNVSNGVVLGFIRTGYKQELDAYTFSGDPTIAQTFSVPTTNYFNTPIDITTENGSSPNQPFLGSVDTLFGPIGPTMSGFVVAYFCPALLLIRSSARYTYLAGVTHSLFAGFCSSDDQLMPSDSWCWFTTQYNCSK
jgi:hypothetical protein